MNNYLIIIQKNLYRMVSTTLLASVIIFNIGRLLGIFEPKGWYVLLCFGISAITFVLEEAFSKKKILTVLVVAIVISVPVYIIGILKVYTFIKTYINWAMSISGWRAEWVDIYQIMQIIWIVVFTYAIQFVLEKQFNFKKIIATGLICLLGYYLISGYEIKYIGVVLDACYIAMILIEWTELSWQKQRRKSTCMYMLWMMPFIVIYCILLLKMPISKEPYDWKYVKAAYNYLEEKFTIWVNDVFGEEDEYDLALSGFSADGTIGDGITENHTEIMTLESNRKMQTNVYLTGKIYNTFDGLSWKANQEQSVKDGYMDTMETLYAAMKYDPGYLYNYAIKSKITICYKDLNTDYLFAPLKSSSVENQWERIEFNVNDGSVFFNDNQNYGSEYNVYFYQVNADAELFYDFLEAEVEYDEALWNKVLSDFKMSTGINLSYQEIDSNSEKYYNYFTDYPELSNQVSRYLDDITKNATTDIEVLRAIEKELSSYTYTQNPGKFPEKVVDGSTFLDYFVLESRQGYCTHYATAFTLLARAKGYPTRYVQGYCVPMIDERTAVVTSSMAHAWPEVYIDDIGWIAFEPTPGYGETRYTPWTTKRITNTEDYFGEDYYSEEEEIVSTPTDVDENNRDENKSSGKIKRILFILKKIIILLMVGLCIVFLGIKIVGKIQYIKKTEEERYYYKITRNFKLLRKIGLAMSDKETLMEYEKRVKESKKINNNLKFIGDYEEVVYGDKAIDDEKHSTVDNDYNQILLILKEESYVKYLWYILW